jgi:transposase
MLVWTKKAFGLAIKYISTLNDLDRSRVLDVIEDQTLTGTTKLLKTLSKQQRAAVSRYRLICVNPL